MTKVSKLAAAVALASGIGVVASVATASEAAHGYKHVFIDVTTHLGFGATGATSAPAGTSSNPVYLGAVPMGSTQDTAPMTEVPFDIHANRQDLDFQCGASDLYKDNNPTSTSKINLDTTKACEITVDGGGSALGGLDNKLAWVPRNGVLIDGFPITDTVNKTFGSGVPGKFTDTVKLKVTWLPPAPELATGEYSGIVSLWMTVPGGMTQ